MATKTLHVNISGMTCVNCSNAVEKVTKKLPGVENVQVSFASSEGEFVYDADKVSSEQIISKIKKLGYGVMKDMAALEAQKTKELTKLKYTLWLAMALAAGVMGLEKFMPFGMHNVWAVWVLASVAQFYAAARFYTHAYGALKNGSYDMNVLIALGTSAAYFYSVSVMLFGDTFPESMRFVYFDGAVMIIAFVLLGKYLEERSKAKATNTLKHLMDLSPKQARVLGEDATESMVGVEALRVGDVVIVKSGEAIPCDGKIIEGSAEIDTSMITGESLPVHKKEGEEVVAGTISKAGYIKVRVSKPAHATMLASIVSLLSEAQNQKMPIGRFADKVSNIFVPTVMLISLATLLGWWFFTGNVLFAFLASVSVLIISCPCALGLATPIAIVSAVGKGAKHGILIKNPEVLEILKSVKYAVFDKTGTLTKGEIAVSHSSVNDDALLGLIGCVEARSEHPISKAVVAHVQRLGVTLSHEVDAFEVLAGLGVQGKAGGHAVAVGSEAFLESLGVEVSKATKMLMQEAQRGAKGAIVAAVNGLEVGCFVLEDTLKEEAKEVIAYLKHQGITPVMLTGDHEATAKSVAEKLGIDLVYAEVLPHQKHAQIEAFQKEAKVLFVGDGINDSPSLKQADIGIALNSGSDIAKDAGDIVLVGNDLRMVKGALVLSRQTMRVIKQNLFWAFIYNILGIPLAAGLFYPWTGWLLTPMYAGMAMSVSSVTVVLNALRLKLLKI
ncbi:MAG: heavy metal translocating P-type ATPase [Campylobacterales bacterium]|nr:heavy metal translocating P-type ATPase [Campylobacterales bacterium]